ncbi:HU family DNA-binding protein [Bacillus mycoides]|uniref:HU family DNA-binding protein n=1 Tax=Bacillus mycoides TaxID=1405 RepID=UPI003D64CAC4
MNTQELAKSVQGELKEGLGLKLNQNDARTVVDTVVAAIVTGMNEHDAVKVAGLGTFSRQFKEAGTARNPKTGEEVQVEAKHLPKFKAAKALKDAVR